MLSSTRLKRTAASIGIICVGLTGATASASPGSGVSPQNFVTASLVEDASINHDRVKLMTKDPTTVRVQRLTFAPGAYTGWHHHPGVVVVAVESGLVTLTDEHCETKTYGPGSPNGSVFIEGHDHAHQASSASGATVYVTYVAPDQTFRIEDPAVSCSQ